MAAAAIEPTAYHRHSVSCRWTMMIRHDSRWRRTGVASQVQTIHGRLLVHDSLAQRGSIGAHVVWSSQPSIQDIAFGSLAGMVSKVFEHPFDLVKVRLQTQSADRTRTLRRAFRLLQADLPAGGVRGLYRGLSMPVLERRSRMLACFSSTINPVGHSMG